jgi:hypothetical protein
MRWFRTGATLVNVLVCGWAIYTLLTMSSIPDMKIATAYVCGKLDQMLSAKGESPAPGCAEQRAIYERETAR